MKMRLTTLGGGLSILLVLVTVLVVVVSLRTTQGIEEMQETWQEFEREAGTEIVQLQRLNAALGYGGMIHQFKNYILRQDAARVEKVRARVATALKTIEEYRAVNHSDAEKRALVVIKKTVIQYSDALDVAVAMVAAGKTVQEIDGAVKIDDTPAMNALKALTQSFIDTKAKSAAAIAEAADRTVDFSRTGSIVVSVALAAVVGILGWFLFIRLGAPLRAMTAVMERLAHGDTSVKVETEGRGDELGDMASAIVVFRENALRIADLEQTARAVVRSIATTTGQVQSAVNAQASSSSEQAASVAETSSALEQIRETAMSTMDRAAELSTSAQRTLSEGEIGAAEMDDSVAAIQSIRNKVEAIARTMVTLSEQNRRVGDITSTVNNLAQQSKMLAINASIEAAKAGDAGKGFAVVAEEMGNLADQSEEATVQVRGVLDEIQAATEKAVLATEEGSKQVDQGVTLIQSAGERIVGLNQVIQEAGTETGRIVGSIRQQFAGIEQVNTAMTEISQGTTQFASASSQIKDSIEELVGEVDKLIRTQA